MKLLTLLSVGVITSYCYKAISHSQLNLSATSFDEIVKQAVLREFEKKC